jgi:hypothetical protein
MEKKTCILIAAVANKKDAWKYGINSYMHRIICKVPIVSQEFAI